MILPALWKPANSFSSSESFTSEGRWNIDARSFTLPALSKPVSSRSAGRFSSSSSFLPNA